MEQTIHYFEKPGPKNTNETLKIAFRRAAELDIKQIIVASTTGETARKALSLRQDPRIKITVVTIPHAHASKGWCIDKRVKQELEEQGLTVFTSIAALGGDVNAAFTTGDLSTMPNLVIQETLYTVCQGLKVCVEMALMTADAGLIDMDQELVAVAGTGSGADTAVVIKPAYAQEFRKLRIRELLAKPR